MLLDPTNPAVKAQLAAKGVSTAVKGLSSLFSGGSSRKRQARRAESNQSSSRVASQPAAKALVQTGSMMLVTKPAPYSFQFLTMNSSPTTTVEFLICPWQTVAFPPGGVSFTWDPAMSLDLESKLEYRIKRCALKYVGTAPTTSTVNVYMGGARNANVPTPSYQEYSLLEKFYVGPAYEPGVVLPLPHDTEWHQIDTDVSVVSDNADIKLFTAGKGFITCDGTGLSLKFDLLMELEFRGRDPVISTDAALYSVSSNANAALSFLSNPTRFAVGSSSLWSINPTISAAIGGGQTAWSLSAPPGYYQCSAVVSCDTESDTAEDYSGFRVYDVTNTRRASQEVQLVNVAQSGGSGNAAVSRAEAAIRLLNYGDQIVFAFAVPNANLTQYVLRMDVVRERITRLQRFWGTAIPTGF